MKLFITNLLLAFIVLASFNVAANYVISPSVIVEEKISDRESEVKKVKSIKWKKEKIRKGVHVKHANVQLFDSKQAIFLVEIDTSRAKLNYFVGMPEALEPTSIQAKDNDAVIAINGSYFNMKEGPSVHFVKIDNEVAANTKQSEFGTRATGIVTISDNKVDIEEWDKDMEQSGAADIDYALVCGPIVIDDNNRMDMWESTFVSARHPRSFIGFNKNKLILGVVDGRDPDRAEGMNLHELRILATGLGCTDLLNLDGGGSSTLYVKGHSDNGIVNIPSDGRERPVKSIIYLKTRNRK